MNNSLSARRSHRWLSKEQRIEVKSLLNEGKRPEQLAVQFDVHYNTIRNIGKEGIVTPGESPTTSQPTPSTIGPICPISPTKKPLSSRNPVIPKPRSTVPQRTEHCAPSTAHLLCKTEEPRDRKPKTNQFPSRNPATPHSRSAAPKIDESKIEESRNREVLQ